MEWRDGAKLVCDKLAGVEVSRIWAELDSQYSE